MTQLRLYKKFDRNFEELIREMDYLKSKGLINEWKLVEDNTLISYSGKYKNVGYGGKVKVSEYKEVYKHITNSISSYSERWGGGLWI